MVAATKMSCKMASALCQKWFKKLGFLSKSSKFCTFWTIRVGSTFASMWSKYVSNYVKRDFRIPLSAFATVVLMANLLQKLVFRSGILCYHY